MDNKCTLCPRACGADREKTKGYCGCGKNIKISKYMVYKGEEPCICGTRGSGAVFFSGCSLRCVFCQNHVISHGCKGEEITAERLAEIFFELKEKGAHNIELITASHFSDTIADILKKYKNELNIPIVYNCSGYESIGSLKILGDLIDVYMPDIKYYSPLLSEKYSAAPDYYEKAIEALKEMRRIQPEEIYDSDGIIKKGVLIRHLVLPKGYRDSIKILEEIKMSFASPPPISLMRQYTPCFKSYLYPEINRKLTTFEYNKVIDKCIELGLEGFMQEKGCETLELTPEF